MLLSVLAVILVSVTNAKIHLPKASADVGNTAYLLPGNLKPSLYEIELEPNFKKETFKGSVRIKLRVKYPTNKVVLHAKYLHIDIKNISLLHDSKRKMKKMYPKWTAQSEDDKEFFSMRFHDILQPHKKYWLVISSFTGTLKHNDSLGFYVGKYTEKDGVERMLATTKFEPTFARRAFPCFDEPALKAQFKISIIRGKYYNSISNAPKLFTKKLSSGRYRDKFQTTVKMSTYLVAFIVSNFSYVGSLNQRVYGRPDLIADERGNYALRLGILSLTYLSEFLNTSYTLEKMDQVAIPDNYFPAGAMENWGIITYKQSNILYSPLVNDALMKQGVAQVIVHEFTHQWFGNLVSPTWWTYVWLNEGFARYMQYRITAEIEQNMGLMNQFLIRGVQYAFRKDCVSSTKPMNLVATTPKEINSLFDTYSYIIYDKAASIIRMVEGIISTKVFRRGLYIYLKHMKSRTAHPSNLYASWQEALNEVNQNPFPPGENISSVLGTWDSNAGFPIVTVTRDYDGGSVTLSQQRFTSPDPDNEDKSIWYVPVSYATATNPDFSNISPQLWLTTRKGTVDVDDVHSDDWLIINLKVNGFYRVNYDKNNWKLISEYLRKENFRKICKLNRAQLIDDSFTLAIHGIIDFEIPLDLTQYIIRETDYIPLKPFLRGVTFMEVFMANVDTFQNFKNHILKQLNTVLNIVGFDEDESDTHVTRLTRKEVLKWASRYGRTDCKEFALKRLREWKDNEDKMILPDMQAPLTCAALSIGKKSDWDFVFQRYRNDSDLVVRKRLIYALGCVEDEDILNEFMGMILDHDSEFGHSDRLIALSSIYSSGNHGRDYAYNYIKDHWSNFVSSFSVTELSVIMDDIAATFSTEEQLDDLKSFAKQVDDESIIKTALGTTSKNVHWSNEHFSSILTWYSKAVNTSEKD